MICTPTPRESYSRFAALVLAFVVLLQAVGLALTAAREGTPLGTWLFVERGWSGQARSPRCWAACSTEVALPAHATRIAYHLSADRRLFGLGLEQREAELLLRLIGVHDVVLAGTRALAWPSARR